MFQWLFFYRTVTSSSLVVQLKVLADMKKPLQDYIIESKEVYMYIQLSWKI